MKEIRFLVGNIGTGKTTYAREKVKEECAIVVSFDAILASLSVNETFDFDLRRYDVMKGMFLEGIARWVNIEHGLLIIDNTNISRKTRIRLINEIKKIIKESEEFIKLKKEEIKLTAVDFGGGDKKSLERRLLKPRNTSREKWIETHEKFKSSYEMANLDEGFSVVTIL